MTEPNTRTYGDDTDPPVRPPAPGEGPSTGKPAQRFTILGLHAQGGLGRVSRARDEDLKREVALKEIRPDRLQSPQARQRFVNEAEITGQLEHPGIVPIYALGHDADGLPYYAMRFVQGNTLADAVRGYHRQPTSLAFRDLLQRFATVCRTVAYAHSRGVIHRDLKPANVLVGDYGETLVVDWGLARRLHQPTVLLSRPPGTEPATEPDAADTHSPPTLDYLPDTGASTVDASPAADDGERLTQAGQVLGTPAYMAPEQAEGCSEQVGPAADLYALGAILYEVLSGRAPYQGQGAAATLALVRQGPPEPPSQHALEVPRALEAVCLKAMMRRPDQRYASAGAIAEEIERWLADEPVRAFPEPLSARLRRVARRRPKLVAGTAGLLTAAVVALAVGTLLLANKQAETDEARQQAVNNGIEADEKRVFAEGETTRANAETARANKAADLARTEEGKARKSADEAREKRQEALVKAEHARRSAYAAQLSQVSLLSDRDPLQALTLLEDTQRCPLDLRDFTWELLHAAAHRNRYSVRLGPSGAAMLPGQEAGEVAFAEAHCLVGLLRQVDGLRVRRFDAEDGTLLGELAVTGNPVVAADRRSAALLTADGELQQYDLVAGRRTLAVPLREHTAPVQMHVFSDDLKVLASVDDRRTLCLWDAETGRLRLRTEGPLGALVSLMFSPGGSRLIAVERGVNNPKTAIIRVWDVGSGKPPRELEGTFGQVSHVTASPDGRLLAVRGEQAPNSGVGEIVLFNLATGKRLPLPRSYAGRDTKLLQFTAGGRSLVLLTRNGGIISGDAGESNNLMIWDVTGEEPGILQAFGAFDAFGVFSPDRRWLALGNHDGLELFDTRTGERQPLQGSQIEKLRPLAFSPDGKVLVTTGVRLWDVASGRELLGLRGQGPIVFSADGRMLAAGDGDKTFTVWDVSSGITVARPLSWNKPAVSVALTRDGRTLALLGGEMGGFPQGRIAELLLFDVPSGDVRATLYRAGSITDTSRVLFTPDDRTLGNDLGERLKLYGTDGKEGGGLTVARSFASGLPRLGGTSLPPSLVAFTPDGRQLAVAAQERIIFRSREGDEIQDTLEAPAPVSTAPSFPDDGRHVAAGGATGEVWIWDVPGGKVRSAPFRHEGGVLAVAFHPDGGRVASAGRDGHIVLWDLADDSRVTLDGHAGPVTVLAFSPDGRALVSGGSDRTVRFWDPVIGQARATFRPHTFPVGCLSFSGSGNTLVTGSEGKPRGGEVLVWQGGERREARGALPLHESVRRVALSPDGSAALALTDRGRLSLWDPRTGQQLEAPLSPDPALAQSAPFGGAMALQVSLDEKRLATVDLLHWQLSGGSSLKRWRQQGGPTEEVLLPPKANAQSPLAYAPAARMAVVALNPGPADDRVFAVLRQVDLRTGATKTLCEVPDSIPHLLSADGRWAALILRGPAVQGLRLVEVATGRIAWESAKSSAVTFSPDGRLLLGAKDNALRVWRSDTGAEIVSLPLTSPLVAAAFSPDGRLLAASVGNKVFLCEMKAGKQPTVVEGVGTVQALTFASNGKVLLGAANSGWTTNLIVCDTVTGEELRRFDLKATSANGLVASPDGRTVLVRALAPVALVAAWDYQTGIVRGQQELPLGIEERLVFPPDGRTVVVHAGEKCELWDADTMKLRRALAGRPGPILAVGATVDGKTLLLSEPKQIRLVDVATGEERVASALPPEAAQLLWGRLAAPAADGSSLLVTYVRAQAPPADVQVRVGTEPEPRTRFTGHSGRVLAVALTRDGRLAASAGEDKVVRLWDTTTGQERRALPGHETAVNVLALSPGEDRLAAAGEDGVVRVWELKSEAGPVLLRGHKDQVRALAFDPDGKLLAVAGDDPAVRVWEARTGQLRAMLRGHDGAVNDVAFSADGRLLISASADGSVRVWDRPGDADEAVVKAPEAVVEREKVVPVAVAADGKTVFRGLPSGAVEILDLASGQRRLFQGKHTGPVLAVTLGPDGTVLATGGGDGVVKLWSTADGKEKTSWAGHGAPVRALAFRPDGAVLASGAGRPPNLFRDRVPSAILLRRVADGGEEARLDSRGGVLALAFAPDGRSLASGGDDSRALIWDLDTRQTRLILKHGGPVSGVWFTPDGEQLVTGSYDRNLYDDGRQNPLGLSRHGKPLRVWDAVSGRELVAPPTSPDAVLALGLSNDGRTLAAVEDDGSVTVWDFATRRELAVLWGNEGGRLAFTADGTGLVTTNAAGATRLWNIQGLHERDVLPGPVVGGLDGAVLTADGSLLAAIATGPRGPEVRILETATGKQRGVAPLNAYPTAPPGTFTLPPGSRYLLAVSPDGKRVAVFEHGTQRPELKIDILDMDTGKYLNALTGYRQPVNALCFSPDGKMLAAAGIDPAIRLWDVESGEVLSVLEGHRQPVGALAFRRDGSLLASGDGEATVKLWSLGSARQVGECVLAQPPGPGVLAGSSYVYLAFDPNGKTLATSVEHYLKGGAPIPDVRLWELLDPGAGGAVLVRERCGLQKPIHGPLAFGADGRTLHLRGGLALAVHATDDGRPLAQRPAGDDDVKLVNGSNRVVLVRNSLVVAERLPLVNLFDARSGKAVSQLMGSKFSSLNVLPAFSEDLKTMLCQAPPVAGTDSPGPVQLIELGSTGPGNPGPSLPLQTFDVAGGTVRGLALAAGKALLVTEDGKVRVYDTGTGEMLHLLSGGPEPIELLAPDPGGKLLALAHRGGTVRVWDLDTGSLLTTLRVGDAAVKTLALSVDGKLATGDARGMLRLWNAADGVAGTSWKAHEGLVGRVVFAPDGKVLASAGGDGSVRLWDAGSGKALARPSMNWQDMVDLSFSPDGKLLAVGTGRGVVVLDRDGKTVSTVGPQDWLFRVGFFSDGKSLFTLQLTAVAPQRQGRLLLLGERAPFGVPLRDVAGKVE